MTPAKARKLRVGDEVRYLDESPIGIVRHASEHVINCEWTDGTESHTHPNDMTDFTKVKV